MISRNPSKRGFTLIELLVVISIIGMLVAVAAVSFSSTQARARDSRRIQDIEAIQKAMEQYAATNKGLYPGAGTTTARPSLPGFTLPTDPRPVVAADTVYLWNHTASAYCICAQLESIAGGNATSGPSTSQTCTYATPTTSASSFYCVSNLQ